MDTLYSLPIIKTKKETKAANSFWLEVPKQLQNIFAYKAGQYLTFQFTIKGTSYRRAYSLYSSPFTDNYLKFCVKRVKKGIVSNFINDNLTEGTKVNLLPPRGRFYANITVTSYKSYYLFAAGSGITPILSIAQSVLKIEKYSQVYLIFGNSNQQTIIFKNELKKLQKAYPKRFTLVHCLSKPLSSWSQWGKPSRLHFEKGRIDQARVKWFIDTYPPYAQNTEYYICGPEKMMNSTVDTLLTLEVPISKIFTESFGESEQKNEHVFIENPTVKVKLDNQQITINMLKGETVLRSLLRTNYNPPFSCEGGVCATCKCILRKGKVFMKKNLSLSEKEIKQGYILSCQSIPSTENIQVDFE